MTDREKLELAAKACGMVVHNFVTDELGRVAVLTENNAYWNPLTDQADSANLRDALEIEVEYCGSRVGAWKDSAEPACYVEHNGTPEDRSRAVREAVLLVAAEIGRLK